MKPTKKPKPSEAELESAVAYMEARKVALNDKRESIINAVLELVEARKERDRAHITSWSPFISTFYIDQALDSALLAYQTEGAIFHVNYKQ